MLVFAMIMLLLLLHVSSGFHILHPSRHRFISSFATIDDDVFGAEFSSSAPVFNEPPADPFLISPSEQMRIAAEEKRWEASLKAQASYDKFRSTFLSDSLFVSTLGLSLTWYFGTFKDSYSFAIGSVLGIAYSILLGKYVEKIGTGEKNKVNDAIRFAPVILLIALYGKFKLVFSIIPELLGFFTSYQLASLLQIFNERAYEEEDDSVS